MTRSGSLKYERTLGSGGHHGGEVSVPLFDSPVVSRAAVFVDPAASERARPAVVRSVTQPLDHTATATEHDDGESLAERGTAYYPSQAYIYFVG